MRAPIACALSFSACLVGCGEDVRVGAQCPSPYVGGATIEPGPDGGTLGIVYGTSCAPCDGDSTVRVDDRGCPVYVTPASCGGDVCLFGRLVVLVGDDAGATGDAGEEDGGE